MNKIVQQITKKIKNLPEAYIQEVLDFVDFMEQKGKSNRDTEYLQNIPGMTKSIKQSRKEKTEDCKTLKDIGWR